MRRRSQTQGLRLGVVFAGIRLMLIDAPFNAITHEIIAAAIEVHRVLGPGLLESAYTPCLHYELTARKIRFITQRQLPIVYKGIASTPATGWTSLLKTWSSSK